MYDTDYNRRLQQQILEMNRRAIDHTKHFYISIDDEIPHALGTGLQYAVADGVIGIGSGKEEDSASDSDEEEEFLEGRGASLGYGVEEYPKNFQGNYLNTAFSTFDKPQIRPMATQQELTLMRDGGCKDCEEYLEGDGMERHDEVKAEMNEMGEEPLLTTKKGRGRPKKGKGFFGGLPDAIAFAQSDKGQALGKNLMDMFNILKGRGIKPEDLDEKAEKLPDDIKQKIMSGKGKRRVQAYLEGSGFFDDLWTGIKMPFEAVGNIAKTVAPYALPIISALGKPKRGRPKKGKGILSDFEESQKKYRPNPPPFITHTEEVDRMMRLSKKGGNIGLAQSPESVKHFQEVLQQAEKERQERKSQVPPPFFAEGRGFFPDYSCLGINPAPHCSGRSDYDNIKVADMIKGDSKMAKMLGVGKKRGRPSKAGAKMNIGLAQSPESVKFFQDKEQMEGGNFFGDLWDGIKSVGSTVLDVGKAVAPYAVPIISALGKPKKRGRPAKKGGAVLPEASSAFGANLEGGRMLIENSQMKGHYGGAKVEKEKKPKKPKSDCKTGIKDRAKIVREVMKEKGLSMIEASKYVKEHNLWKSK